MMKIQQEMKKINQETLKHVLTRALGEKITAADYTTGELQGGTVGDVLLVKGTARTVNGENRPYRVVLKIQEKWERYGDPLSWRREYDLYSSGLSEYFFRELRWPECYYKEMNEEENEAQIWMEYVAGVTGLDLTEDMYERAAYELGKFQGRLYAEKPSMLNQLSNLSDQGFIERYYQRYRSWNVVYDYIRSESCEIPKHLCEMLIAIDDQADELFRRIEKLPAVLCHRDFWVANLFSSDGEIRLIDWDTAGWGFLGEDLASLIADESEVDAMVSLYQRCVPAYMKGFSEHVDISHIKEHYVWERILLMFGYRIVEWFLDGESAEEKKLQVDTLQKIYEMAENQDVKEAAPTERLEFI